MAVDLMEMPQLAPSGGCLMFMQLLVLYGNHMKEVYFYMTFCALLVHKTSHKKGWRLGLLPGRPSESERTCLRWGRVISKMLSTQHCFLKPYHQISNVIIETSYLTVLEITGVAFE